MHPGLFEALLPLLAHGALESEAPPRSLPFCPGNWSALFARPRVDHFVDDARRVAGCDDLALRTRDVGFLTGNPLTARFLPARASDVPRALGTALREVEAGLRARAGDARALALHAWLGGQLLLTIHPFPDGNGRIARAFMAANLLRHAGPAPTALLAMLLAHATKGQRYHQALWAFRAGCAEPLTTLFRDAESAARVYLGPALQVASVPPGWLAECHSWLRTQLQ